MRIFNHELTVRRNESFTIDKIVENRDGSPYIISSELKNPHFVITVSSTLYPTDNGYIIHIWLPVELPRFKSTVPVNILDFKKENGDSLYSDGFESMTGLPSGIFNDAHVTFEFDDAIFYYDSPTEGRIYKYAGYTVDDNGEKVFDGWRDYKCRIVYKFTHGITRDWIEGNYFYNIDLIDGIIDENAKLGERPILAESVSEHIPILGATKLTVLSDLRGGM